jgi:nucleotide-binding universal stress UspA family protein
MERKLLLAVDASRHSQMAVRYTGRLLGRDAAVCFDLLNIQPALSDFLVDEARRSAASRRHLDKLSALNAKYARQTLAGLKAVLETLGVSEDRMALHTAPRGLGLAKDILDFGLERRHDAVVLGRHGTSGLKDVFFGSVSNTVVHQSKVLPVWLIDGDVEPGRILVPVDGSASALRAVDHLAFMLAGRKDCRLTFFHVQPKLRQYCAIDFDDAAAEPLEEMVASGADICIDNFYGKARHKLAAFDIGEHQVEIETRSGRGSIGEMICEEMAAGGYRTVVMGRRGSNHSYFMGSVTQYLLGKTEDRALWIVP